MEFTPINAWKLSTRGKEVLKACEAILKHDVPHVRVDSSDFKELLDGVSPFSKHLYEEGIPLCGKLVIRK